MCASMCDCVDCAQAVSKHLDIPVAQLRLWHCEPRDNKTVRLDAPLQDEALLQPVHTLVSTTFALIMLDLHISV